MAIKKSNFNADTEIPAGSTFDFVINGQNLKITKEDIEKQCRGGYSTEFKDRMYNLLINEDNTKEAEKE